MNAEVSSRTCIITWNTNDSFLLRNLTLNSQASYLRFSNSFWTSTKNLINKSTIEKAPRAFVSPFPKQSIPCWHLENVFTKYNIPGEVFKVINWNVHNSKRAANPVKWTIIISMKVVSSSLRSFMFIHREFWVLLYCSTVDNFQWKKTRDFLWSRKLEDEGRWVWEGSRIRTVRHLPR